MPALIDLENLGLSLGGHVVLHDVTLRVRAGEIVGVAGTNGTGKTTLLKVMATLLTPDTGHGTILGAHLGTPEVFQIRRQVGLVSHVPSVIPELTIEENLTHMVRLAGDDPDRITAALRVVGLEGVAGRRLSASSFGMMRRTEIARLLITRPRLLLLDEALSGLDAEARALIDALIDRTIEADGCCVLVSHDSSQMMRAGSILTLSAGSLTEQT